MKKTFKYTSGEFNESAHSTLRRSEELHKFRVCRKLGTDKHLKLSMKSLTYFSHCLTFGTETSINKCEKPYILF